ncbi:MAG: branched-chain amino acid aminotransferase [Oscillospiraceae bacterium]|jgi:branched-chain amino acid aminotransferase|nr:branched-chain amino acid aminotransferase [Oscillospiraceae bacterium]
MSKISIELTKSPKAKPADESSLSFGTIFTDHMFIMNYDKGEGWHDPRIVPYAPISLEPSAMCLHYGQEVFEGLKAYRTEKDEIQLFRPDQNFKRLNVSNERLSIPAIDEELALEALKQLINIEKDWIPRQKDTSLYIRPFIISTDPHLGVRPGHNYLFMIILSPVGSYYAEGLNPVKIYVETNYVRAVKGGTGMAKTGGNYASSLNSQVEAKEKNYSQVLWLDGVERKYIEEVGAMNIFFVIGDEVVTPSLGGSILDGITRKSSIELMKSWGLKVVERRISIDEIVEAYRDGQLKEVFGTGTAAVISPVGHLRYDDIVMEIGDNKIGRISEKLYDEMTGIQWGRVEDKFGWTIKIG